LSALVGSTQRVQRSVGTVPVTVIHLFWWVLSVNGEVIAKIEFITHLDMGTVTYYAAQIGTKPYRFVWFTKLGAVQNRNFALNKGLVCMTMLYASV
jgi:hypothetical protein